MPAAHEADAARLRQVAAAAASATDYADALSDEQPGKTLHQAIEQHLHQALGGYYRLGQLAAMPALLGEASQPATAARLPTGTTQLTDRWCLTDPSSRTSWQRDPAARRAIEQLWANDPDPGATLRIQQEIDSAEHAGAVTPARDEYGRALGHYFCCPWAAAYQVLRPVVIAGQRLPVGSQFAYDVSAEEVAEGGEFVRRLVTGPFTRTDRVDYCDPTTGGHHDD